MGREKTLPRIGPSAVVPNDFRLEGLGTKNFVQEQAGYMGGIAVTVQEKGACSGKNSVHLLQTTV